MRISARSIYPGARKNKAVSPSFPDSIARSQGRFGTMKPASAPIQGYDDFRKLLKDRYQALKDGDPKFSHRYFCRKAGYGSSSAFADVLAGRRKLGKAAALRLAQALQLNRGEEEYFLCLVDFNQAGTLEEKNLHYARLLSLKGTRIDVLSPDKYAYFSAWYHAALRELLYFHPCSGDFRELGRRLNPPVPAAKAKKAVLLMEKLGLLARDAQGRYRQTSKLISTDDAGGSLHVENFQAETLKLAREALDRHPPSVRDISTITATLSRDSVDRVKAALKELRRLVLTLAEQDEKVDRVYQLNLQLFPLSRIEARRKESHA